MRLKYLFFPIVMVMAVAVFWGYIWPEIVSFRAVDDEYKASKQALEAVQAKRATLEQLSLQIKSKDQDRSLVLSYLPMNKVEERIIGQVNYLAASSNVFLDNVKIVSKDATLSSNEQVTQVGLLPGVANNGSTAANSVDPNAKSQVVDAIQNTQATISISGDYANLKKFFGAIQHMPLFNSVESLRIATIEEPKTDANLPAKTIITAEMVVDFGYLKQVRADGKKLAELNVQIDNGTLEQLNKYISASIPEIGVDGVNIGSNNPFLP